MGAIRRHVWISGRVQGVSYRLTCAETARGAGVAGWVRNLPDGRVEAVFEGPATDVESVLAWCGDGPPAARVAAVQVVAESPTGLRDFDVRG